MRVIGVTSGKGALVKRRFPSTSPLRLAKRGKRVVLLDGDLGLSNAQILLNARVEYSYGHVLSVKKRWKRSWFSLSTASHWCCGLEWVLGACSPDTPAVAGFNSRAFCAG